MAVADTEVVTFRVMASHTVVVLNGGDHRVAIFAERELQRLETIWSRFLPGSDISRLNRSDGVPTKVADDTIDLVEHMKVGHEATAGRFDPTLLPALIEGGYGESVTGSGQCSTIGEGCVSRRPVGDIVIDRTRSTVTLPTGLTLDPGGIGKGFAADLTVSRLIRQGAEGALVSIGGDLACAGRPPEPAGWTISVEYPDPGAGELTRFLLDRGGVATSSTRSRRWSDRGSERHHLLDPGTGASVTNDVAASTVIAGTGWLAEVHATAALVCGGAGGLHYLAENELSGVLVLADGSVLSTADLAGLFAGRAS